MTAPARSSPFDEILPVPRLFVLGLQHVLAMYAGAAAVPLIIGGAIHLPKEQIATLVSADLLVCGIVTIVQCVGYVIGGAAIVMFGMVSATGVKILGQADFVANKCNLYIVAVSVALAMIPIVADQFFDKLLAEIGRFFQSSVMVGTLAAVLLNLLFNGMPRSEKVVAQQVAPAE